MIPVTLLTEDDLSTAIAECLLEELDRLIFPRRLGRGGFGYIRKKMNSWCQLAEHQPVFVLTDLDRKECPVALIHDWFGSNVLPQKLIFRIAVREVEAWLLADHIFMKALIGERGGLPSDPESLSDPKATLLRLVDKYATREIRSDVVRNENGNLKQGINYNDSLMRVVRNAWNPERAAELSPSLRRARLRMQEWKKNL